MWLQFIYTTDMSIILAYITLLDSTTNTYVHALNYICHRGEDQSLYHFILGDIWESCCNILPLHIHCDICHIYWWIVFRICSRLPSDFFRDTWSILFHSRIIYLVVYEQECTLCRSDLWIVVIVLVFTVISVVSVFIVNALRCLGLGASMVVVATYVGGSVPPCAFWYDSVSHLYTLYLLRRAW